MPDNPRISYVLNLSAGSNTSAATVIVENLSKTIDSNNPTNTQLVANLDSNRKSALDLANLSSGYSNGDIILCTVTGIRSGRVTHTVNTNKGGADLTFTETAADYAGASISI